MLRNETWVRIMQNDTTVSYFTAKKDFTKFVAQYRKKEAEEKQGEKQPEKSTERIPEEEHLQNPEENAMMAFERWSKSIKPFVMANGKIMPVEQRMAVINREK